MTKLFVRALLFTGLCGGVLLAAASCSNDHDGAGGPAAAGAGSGGASSAGFSGNDLNVGGASAPAGDAGSGGSSEPACPLYQSLCDGSCIPTSVDPDNCGACAKKCAASEVCSAGVCSGECLPGLTACQGTCADFQNDSTHCGDCDTACEAGQGCADGRCVDVVAVGPDPKQCAGGGPPIRIGDGPLDCLGTLAQTTFRWSLCSCTDLNVSAALSTDAYDSSVGPYQPGELGGGVAADRNVTNWSEAVTVGGTLWIAGSDSYSSSGPPSSVKGDLHLAGSWKASTPFTVDGAAYLGGTLSGVTVKGKTTPVTAVAPACDCTPDKLIPIAAIVKAHQADNEDAAIGLDPAVFEKPGAPLRLDLPCGNFYLTAIDVSLALTIHVHGRAALYVAGDVAASSSLAFTLEPDAELDLFVAGTLKASDTFVFGSPNYPALSRAYIGGSAKIALSDDVRLGGELYAASSEQLVWSAKNAIYGSIFAGNFRSSDVTNIHYDRGVLRAGDKCPPDPHECGSCEDCHNQACKNGVCGECGADSDCCSPLVCIGGSCQPQIVVVK